MVHYLLLDHDTALKLALLPDLGKRCRFCGRVFETFKDLDDAICAGSGRRPCKELACKGCWETHKSQEGDKHPCQPTS